MCVSVVVAATVATAMVAAIVWVGKVGMMEVVAVVAIARCWQCQWWLRGGAVLLVVAGWWVKDAGGGIGCGCEWDTAATTIVAAHADTNVHMQGSHSTFSSWCHFQDE